MHLTIKEPRRSLSDSDLQRLEAQLFISLPSDYADFLKRYNGGRPIPKRFHIPTAEGHRTGQVLDFFGVDDPVQSCRLDWNARVFPGRTPADFLPVACEDGGNIICMRLGQNEFGSVYYWDHHMKTEQPSDGSLFRIAGSFSGFLSALF
jgi:hypothetical protein